MTFLVLLQQDVYKRQVQQIVQTLGLDDRLDALPNQLSGGQQPVSYTHLDVYKRQFHKKEAAHSDRPDFGPV